jgi:hypothetical protein
MEAGSGSGHQFDAKNLSTDTSVIVISLSGFSSGKDLRVWRSLEGHLLVMLSTGTGDGLARRNPPAQIHGEGGWRAISRLELSPSAVAGTSALRQGLPMSSHSQLRVGRVGRVGQVEHHRIIPMGFVLGAERW